MQFKLKNKNDITLHTKNKYCREDISIGIDDIEKEKIVPENIAEGQSILGVTGTFRGGIDTSDGTITADKVLKDEVGYANEERIVGTIETYDYSASEEVKPEIDKFLQGELTELYNDRVTKIVANRCEMDKALIKIDLPNVTYIGSEAFKECTNLEVINLPNLLETATSSFTQCSGLKEVTLPKLTTLGASTFVSSSNLQKLNVPSVTSFGNSAIAGTAIETIVCPSLQIVGQRAFSGPSANSKCYLKTIYIPNAKTLQTNAFYRASAATAIIITQTEQVCTLPEAIATAFKYAYHYLGTVDSYNNPDGLKDGYIYVDASMVDQYKAATNWSALADQIKPLEEIPQEIKEELGL
jgi:hypothetical protein